MTPQDAKEFAAELVLSNNTVAMGIILNALKAHEAGVLADAQTAKKATAIVNDGPRAPKPGSSPVLNGKAAKVA
jgi:hypothetical protein